eukprot:scaffold2808_cov421-Prasinococcus_capsulatus_cf.AAC.4
MADVPRPDPPLPDIFLDEPSGAAAKMAIVLKHWNPRVSISLFLWAFLTKDTMLCTLERSSFAHAGPGVMLAVLLAHFWRSLRHRQDNNPATIRRGHSCSRLTAAQLTCLQP